LLLLAGFMWPDGPNYPRSLNLGSIEQYEAGTATVVPAPDDYDTSRWPNVRTQIAPEVVHQARMWAVRLEDGSIRVLLARDPFDGCTVPWRETFQYEGQEGWFRNPCHGSTYALDGRWVDGASARDMDWFAVHVEPDGDVVVDLTTLHAGET